MGGIMDKIITINSLSKFLEILKRHFITRSEYEMDTSIPSTDPTNTKWIEKVYPVGSIYMSVVNTNPSLIFNIGEWEAIEDKFLLGAGTHIAGEMGGEESHILTEEELAPHHHHHTPPMLTAEEDEVNGFTVGQATNKVHTKIASIEESDATGGGQPHNNMPPYLVVYMWKRIS